MKGSTAHADQTVATASPQSGGEAVAAALAMHGRWLQTVLAARGVDRHSIDDVMQDIAAAALVGIDRLRDASKLGPWLYRLTATQALLHRRKVGRRRKLVERYVDRGAAPNEAAGDDPLAWLLADEQLQLVRRTVAELPPRDAEILILKYTEDWSYRQLAERLGASPSAVEARLHRARARFRAALVRAAPALVPQT